MQHVSPSGDQGYPGTLTATVTYTLTDDDEVHVNYAATADATTVVNLVNHTYFNLAGKVKQLTYMYLPSVKSISILAPFPFLSFCPSCLPHLLFCTSPSTPFPFLLSYLSLSPSPHCLVPSSSIPSCFSLSLIPFSPLFEGHNL